MLIHNGPETQHNIDPNPIPKRLQICDDSYALKSVRRIR